ncbi:MAG TPA: DUF1688 family protein [Kofleriaceae bacterium]
MSELTAAIAYLRSPLAIRARCETILEAGLADQLRHFSVSLDKLPAVVDTAVASTRAKYPDLEIPAFTHVARLDAELADLTPEEKARAAVELVIVSVLLDEDASDAFRTGQFSSIPGDPLRADASGLRDASNKTIRALGGAVSLAPRTFRFGRLGGIVDALLATGATIAAPALLQVLLEALAPMWPDSVTVGDVTMGDVWHHPAAGGAGPSAGLVPFHKHAQWIAYSMVEPLAAVGISVQHLGALTALADQRTSSLLVDQGLLVPRYEALDDEVVTEWRALTIALLDRVADGVQKALGKTTVELPLSSVLQIL